MSDLLEQHCAELEAMGDYYRRDWSGFDGRTFRNEMEQLAENLRAGKISDYWRRMLKL